MNETVICVENIGKLYQIGGSRGTSSYKTLRESLPQLFTYPYHCIRSCFGQKRKPAHCEKDDYWALKDISFEIKQGEIVGIIGRNGAGKSTLLKILSRVTTPTEGRAEIYGRVGSLLEVGTGFHPDLTGRENIYLNGAILGMKRIEIEHNMQKIIDFAEIDRFLDTPIKHYSSGMYVRLAFAVAAHLQPEILMIDEVLAVGDLEFQKKCIGKVGSVTEEGKTVLIVSHSMGSIKAICNRAILLDCGRIKSIGDIDKVVGEYLNMHEADQAEKIIEDCDYVTGNKKIRVNRVKLLNSRRGSFSVFWQQPITVSIEIEATENVSNVSFGAGIRKSDGTWVFFSHHDDYGSRPRWSFEPGKYNIRFTIENILKPGIYRLCFGAHSEIYTRNLFHIESINLEVLDHTEDGLIPLVYNDGFINARLLTDDPEPLNG